MLTVWKPLFRKIGPDSPAVRNDIQRRTVKVLKVSNPTRSNISERIIALRTRLNLRYINPGNDRINYSGQRRTTSPAPRKYCRHSNIDDLPFSEDPARFDESEGPMRLQFVFQDLDFGDSPAVGRVGPDVLSAFRHLEDASDQKKGGRRHRGVLR